MWFVVFQWLPWLSCTSGIWIITSSYKQRDNTIHVFYEIKFLHAPNIIFNNQQEIYYALCYGYNTDKNTAYSMFTIGNDQQGCTLKLHCMTVAWIGRIASGHQLWLAGPLIPVIHTQMHAHAHTNQHTV